jgi:hypothetical protein
MRKKNGYGGLLNEEIKYRKERVSGFSCQHQLQPPMEYFSLKRGRAACHIP